MELCWADAADRPTWEAIIEFLQKYLMEVMMENADISVD